MIQLATDCAVVAVDVDALDAIADRYVSPDAPQIHPAWCATCWAVPLLEFNCTGWAVVCSCGNKGPVSPTMEDAKAAWGTAQWARYSTDSDDQHDPKAPDDARHARRVAVAKAYTAYAARNPLTIKARHWATHRTSKCCNATYAIVRHENRDDPRAVCRGCGKSFAVARILRAKEMKETT